MVDGFFRSVSLDQLLAQRKWLSGLARALVRDESRAQDLEQEVWLKALEKSPPELRSPRGWLSTLARRAAVDQHRSDKRRRRRERAAGPEPGATSTDDLAAQADIQQWVTRAVLALDEPYRGTVLLHHVGGNSVAQVAQIQDVPVETVRTRLRRARATLRKRLDQRHGGSRSSWCLLLRPIAEGAGLKTTAGAGATAAVGGVALMGSKSVVVAGLVLLVVLAYALWPTLQEDDVTADSVLVSGVDDYPNETPSDFLDSSAGPTLSGRPGEMSDDEPILIPPATAAPDEEPTRSTASKGARVAAGVVAGHARDVEGELLPGVTVILWDALGMRILNRTKTDPQGVFRFEGLSEVGYVVSFHTAGWVRFSQALEAGDAYLEVSLDLLGTISGTVVFEGTGTTLAHAYVTAMRVQSPPDPRRAQAWTDGKGDFTVRGLPRGRYHLSVGYVAGGLISGPGHIPKRVGPFEVGARDIRIEVDPGLTIEGTVRGPDGTPWGHGATVRVSAISDTGTVDYETQRITGVTQDGTFHVGGLGKGAFDLTVTPLADPPAVSEFGAATAHLVSIPAGSTDLLVDLPSGEPLTGRLVDENGDPVVAKGSIWVSLDGSGSGTPGSVQAMLEAGGRFVTPPLDPGRAYTVTATGFKGYGDALLKGAIPGNEEIALTLSRGLQISGQVVSEHGHPVHSGVPVNAQVIDLEGDEYRETWALPRTTTDEQGNFTLGGLVDRKYKVWAGGGRTQFVATAAPPVVLPDTRALRVSVRRGAKLSGRIVMASGEGILGLVIQVRGTGPLKHATSWTTCDDEGKFAFEAVPEGMVQIGAKVHGEYHWWGPFQAGSENVTVKVSP